MGGREALRVGVDVDWSQGREEVVCGRNVWRVVGRAREFRSGLWSGREWRFTFAWIVVRVVVVVIFVNSLLQRFVTR